MSSTIPIDILQAAILTKIMEVSACAVFLWDYILTVAMEIHYVWPGPWNALKILYLFQRYIPFVDSLWLALHFNFGKNMSLSTCAHVAAMGRGMMCVGLVASEMLLTFRIWAIWKRNQVLTYVLPILYFGCFIPNLVIHFKAMTRMEFINLPLPFRGCIPAAGNDPLKANWAVFLAWDSIMLCLMIIPIINAYKYRCNAALFTAVYGEGVVYYIYLFAISTMNVLLLSIHSVPESSRPMMFTMSRCIHSTLASRALLHIRASVDEGDLREGQKINNIVFADVVRTQSVMKSEGSQTGSRSSV